MKDTLENVAFMIIVRPENGRPRVQMGNPYLLCLIVDVFLSAVLVWEKRRKMFISHRKK